MKTDIKRVEEIKDIINEKEGVLLYFFSQNCNVCKALRPKTEAEFKKNFPKIEQIFIDISDTPDIAAHFLIFSAPSILIFLQSKEFARESGNISIIKLIEKIKRPYKLMH